MIAVAQSKIIALSKMIAVAQSKIIALSKMIAVAQSKIIALSKIIAVAQSKMTKGSYMNLFVYLFSNQGGHRGAGGVRQFRNTPVQEILALILTSYIDTNFKQFLLLQLG